MTASALRLPSYTLTLGLLAGGAVLLAADPALAQGVGGGGSLETFLTNIVNIITGRVGQLIAVIAIAISGVAWMMGAASPRSFFGTVAGVAIVFSAAWIVQQITGGGGI
ncbi:TrbC/VirB2 family protein [Falsiroseomonas sp. HC035]|uniref:TrbC/VirB2 family protein n=1 Tax=Falsiroseomonas sp. HC035 TaxID=3390999 RepID=UPI003D323269